MIIFGCGIKNFKSMVMYWTSVIIVEILLILNYVPAQLGSPYYFIPVIPYKSYKALVCPICRVLTGWIRMNLKSIKTELNNITSHTFRLSWCISDGFLFLLIQRTHDTHHIFLCQMSVNYGGFQVAMAQKALYCSDIIPFSRRWVAMECFNVWTEASLWISAVFRAFLKAFLRKFRLRKWRPSVSRKAKGAPASLWAGQVCS
jgi:hypothetical protein